MTTPTKDLKTLAKEHFESLTAAEEKMFEAAASGGIAMCTDEETEVIDQGEADRREEEIGAIDAGAAGTAPLQSRPHLPAYLRAAPRQGHTHTHTKLKAHRQAQAAHSEVVEVCPHQRKVLYVSTAP